MPRWVPNFFTALRILLVPFVIRAILAGNDRLALEMFAFAAVTDILDGATARHFGLASPTGAYFDPIADKLLLSGAFVALAAAGRIPWWLVGIVFGRDLYILVGAGLLLWQTTARKFPPSVWGKLSTFAQVVTAVVWMARNLLVFPAWDAVSFGTLWVCAGFTILSGIHYTWRGIEVARAH
ncbi:MAG TPA: CDP-alcohol phosphatidyltransferase family protein [Bryobacteraceae bacterium]|nr:CDP-alcohol phosphatidyltransferase family protein [Bryobacteraceae bacterium]